MRRVRPLILLIIAVLVVTVGGSFYVRSQQQKKDKPRVPPTLPDGTLSTAQDWKWKHSDPTGKTLVEVSAKDYRQTSDPNQFELLGVDLRISNKEADAYNEVKSARAEFDIGSGMLFSAGDVEITMNVPADHPPKGRLMVIRSSGVHFDTKSGKATTDKPASFEFNQGSGKAVGAAYDPGSRELHMQSQVSLDWRGASPKAKPMHIEAAELIYRERESKVYLMSWSKLTRETLNMNAGPAVVTLVDKAISVVEAQSAHGVDTEPSRNLEYSAEQMTMNLDDSGQVKKITGERNARLVAKAPSGMTTVTGDRADLDFLAGDTASTLDTAVATGHAVLESKPAPNANGQTPETRVLRSETVRAKMRAGGQEIESMQTDAAGSVEFIPNRPEQPHRTMNGERIWITYGAGNAIQQFRSVNASTRTEMPKQPDAKQPPPPRLTWSKNLTAEFEPKTSQIQKLEQWNDFRYQEGERRAKADHATLENSKNLITLAGGARVWDSNGATSGDRIVLDQKNGDFTAEGGVNSTRMPDKKGDSSGMLAQDEPLHARARKMFSSDNNLQIRYEGNAVLWQGANRLQADIVEIDRDNGVLKAHGHVISQLLDKKTADAKPAKTSSPVFTVVRAPELIYTDENRLAYYKGGAMLERPTLRVRAREIQAFLKPAETTETASNAKDAKSVKVANDAKKSSDDSGSSLDHALADGAVEIVQTGSGRTRIGTSEHAEYYAEEGRLVLEKGQPRMADSSQGTTQGRQLTWFSNDDRLLINGALAQPSKSLLIRK